MSVAIAVPNLNQGQYLGAALDSVRSSRLTVYRAVLDAGSTDGSPAIIASRAAELTFWRSRRDAGQAAAINEGIARLCERRTDIDVVGWLNADDVFLDGGLEQLHSALVEHPDWVAVCGRGALIGGDGATLGEIPTEPFSRDRFSRACTICQPATLIRRAAWERIRGLDATLDMCFDYDMWWRLSRLGPLGYLDAIVAASRDHLGTKTRQRRAQYFREATAIVRRETGSVPWHWYISEALERQVDYEIGRRPGMRSQVKAGLQAVFGYLRRASIPAR
jgi:GT2 family glycosyltransferase